MALQIVKALGVEDTSAPELGSWIVEYVYIHPWLTPVSNKPIKSPPIPHNSSIPHPPLSSILRGARCNPGSRLYPSVP
jgi:hypothetical protein